MGWVPVERGISGVMVVLKAPEAPVVVLEFRSRIALSSKKAIPEFLFHCAFIPDP